MLSIRPESIRIRRPGVDEASDALGVLPATIRDVVYAGNLCDVFLGVGDFKIRAQVHPRDVEGFRAGDAANVVFDARSVWPVTKDATAARLDVVDADPAGAEPGMADGLAPSIT